MSAGTATAQGTIELATAELSTAWDNHQRNGLEFGRVCCEWKEKIPSSKGGFDSKGEGLSGILTVLDIPRHIFDYWVRKYELSIGKRTLRCSVCDAEFDGFCSLSKHRHIHNEPAPAPEPAPVAPVVMPAADVPTVPMFPEEIDVHPSVAVPLKVGMVLEFAGRFYEVKAGWRNDPDDKSGESILTPYLKFMFPSRLAAPTAEAPVAEPESAEAAIQAVIDTMARCYEDADAIAWDEARKIVAAATKKFGVAEVGRALAKREVEGTYVFDVFGESADLFLETELTKEQYDVFYDQAEEQRQQKRGVTKVQRKAERESKRAEREQKAGVEEIFRNMTGVGA